MAQLASILQQQLCVLQILVVLNEGVFAGLGLLTTGQMVLDFMAQHEGCKCTRVQVSKMFVLV